MTFSGEDEAGFVEDPLGEDWAEEEASGSDAGAGEGGAVDEGVDSLAFFCARRSS